ncbi:galactosyltransferase-related protein [Flavivirga amylovorans]|uniref:Galactosyltransferase-related protein n=1 Tax=Flavivirga amylovorans TaxID=870486 RepID=A0ABT8WYC5_9FLAO|nr:galactosyltransferase-related protein [Flavivirga amylovorans]MDO5986379.1 galactosyltransferase-related protein [Flavivirga amylovorans]
MFSIIYPYRNRDIQRVKNSLESLEKQTSKNFEVYFVNYGSDKIYTKQVEDLLVKYSSVKYSYLYTEQQPWNKSKAINSVLKSLESGYFFVADIDMIFHLNFIKKALKLLRNNEAYYFQVGFLSEEESRTTKNFKDYTIKFKSNEKATGLTLCSVESAKAIGGFDEFYHFWGSEDTDFHIRLKNAGGHVNFYNKEVLMLHQWHETYRNKEVKTLSKSLQVSGIVQFNHFYLKKAAQEKRTVINNENFGKTQSKKDYEKLVEHKKNNIKLISNKQVEIDYFLFKELPCLEPGLHTFKIYEAVEKSLKSVIKRKLKKSNTKYYSLKTINDKLLFHIINFYSNYHYNYSISEDLKSIRLVINKL